MRFRVSHPSPLPPDRFTVFCVVYVRDGRTGYEYYTDPILALAQAKLTSGRAAAREFRPEKRQRFDPEASLHTVRYVGGKWEPMADYTPKGA